MKQSLGDLKLRAEIGKLRSEKRKLDAETQKIARERRLIVWTQGAAMLTAAAVAAGAVAGLLRLL